jgi:hypothetical protein
VPAHRLSPILAVALLIALSSTSLSARGGDGDYVIGETRTAQQGTFCADTGIADEVAGLFQRFGAPTGYAALSASPRCRLQVHTFTPLRMHREVEIALSSGGHYTVRFIVVDVAAAQAPAGQRILITTRALRSWLAVDPEGL